MTILFLCGSDNSVNRCKSVSNGKLFEKTNPIFEGKKAKIMKKTGGKE